MISRSSPHAGGGLRICRIFMVWYWLVTAIARCCKGATRLKCIKAFAHSKPAIRLLMGLCFGIALSLVIAPFIEDHCARFLTPSARGIEIYPDEDNEDYELVIQPLPTSKDEGGKQPSIVRPRYLFTELGIKEKLFVSVFTNARSIETRGVAVNRTANHLVQKLTFFMNGGQSSVLPPGLPVVTFSNNQSHMVPFHTIKYISDHYLNAYDWFYFQSDSTYMRADRLMDFVLHVSVAQNLMIGKPVETENEKVFACDLEAGILLSQPVMVAVVDNLDWCIRNSMPGKDDALNLRTCLARAAEDLNITCIDQVNELSYGYHTGPSLNLTAPMPESQLSELSKAVAIGSFKKEQDFYRLHRLLSEYEMKLVRKQLDALIDEITKVAPLTPEGNKSLVWPIGITPPTKPLNRFDLIQWDYFTETHIYFDDDFTNIRELKGVNKQDIQDIMSTALERLNSKYDNRFQRMRLINGYRRFDAARGMEYILDLALFDRKSNNEIFKRLNLLRPLGDVEIVPMPYVTENARVNLLLAVRPGEKDDVLSFFDSYAQTCLKSGDNTYLFVVFIFESQNQEREDIYAVIKSTIAVYENRYHSGTRITWTSVQSGSADSIKVSYMVLDALAKKLSPESLVVRCTVGMELSIEFLNRVRMNTIKGWQVFFPIGFWSYKPNLIYDQHPYPTKIEISSKSGRYDTHQYTHASFYIEDYLYAKRQLAGAGGVLGTVDLYDLFVQYHSLHVFRAVEPELKLQFHFHNCTGLVGRAQSDCQDSRAHSLAARSQLGMLIFEYQQKLDQMQLKVMHQQRGENVGQMKPEMLRKK